jgi:hypothetical protein
VRVHVLTYIQWWSHCLFKVAALRSSGGSLVATPDFETAVLGSPQPTVDCQSLDRLPSGMALLSMLSSEGQHGRIKTIGTSVPPKKLKGKKGVALLYFCYRQKQLLTLNPLPILTVTAHYSY